MIRPIKDPKICMSLQNELAGSLEAVDRISREWARSKGLTVVPVYGGFLDTTDLPRLVSAFTSTGVTTLLLVKPEEIPGIIDDRIGIPSGESYDASPWALGYDCAELDLTVADLEQAYLPLYYESYVLTNYSVSFTILIWTSEFWLLAAKDEFVRRALGRTIPEALCAFRRDIEALHPTGSRSALYIGFDNLAARYGVPAQCD